jgi:hypothetical protein
MIMNRIWPREVIAERRLIPCRAPVVFDDGRFALLTPTTPGVMIRAHVGSIAKEDLRFFPLRKGFDLRVFLLEPLLDQGLVALLRAVQRLLASDAELRQQSTNRIGAQRDAKLIQDQLGHHRG